MRFRIRVETTNRHVHASAWQDAARPADIETVEDGLTFGPSTKKLWITDEQDRRTHFNPAHVVAVTIETEESPDA